MIKIEDPGSGGDVCRYVPPFQEGEDSLFFETFNRNKKSSRSTSGIRTRARSSTTSSVPRTRCTRTSAATSRSASA